MPMPICEICKREYQRKTCNFCIREKQWDTIWKKEYTQKLFSTRIIQNLHNIEPPKFPKNLKRGQYLHGPTGTGKTFKACSIMLESIHNYCITREGNRDHVFVTVPQLLKRIKKTYNQNPEETEDQILDEMIQVNFLLLDDFGAEKENAWARQIMHLIISERYEWMRTTFFTSNLDLNELTEKLGDDRIPSRIRGMCEIIQSGDKDLRCRKHDTPK